MLEYVENIHRGNANIKIQILDNFVEYKNAIYIYLK